MLFRSPNRYRAWTVRLESDPTALGSSPSPTGSAGVLTLPAARGSGEGAYRRLRASARRANDGGGSGRSMKGRGGAWGARTRHPDRRLAAAAGGQIPVRRRVPRTGKWSGMFRGRRRASLVCRGRPGDGSLYSRSERVAVLTVTIIGVAPRAARGQGEDGALFTASWRSSRAPLHRKRWSDGIGAVRRLQGR